jgi:glycosyltransferase involved in cell wall biosynthesis
MALHVCYVEAAYPHPHGGGGAGTYVRLVGRELVRRGVRVSVVAAWCPDCPSYYCDDGIAVHRPRRKGNLHWYLGKLPGLRSLAQPVRYLENGWRWHRMLDALHRRERFSVVEFTEGGDFWHAFRHSFPVVTHLHGSQFTFLRHSSRPLSAADHRQRRLELAFIRRARRVFSPSRNLVEAVRQEMEGPLPPEVVLPYPLDPRLLAQDGAASEEKEGSPPTVLFAARNDPVKGAATLLQAVPLVRRHIPDAVFLLVGPQPAPGDLRPEGVRFIPFVPRDQLFRYYREATVCVVPSLWDNSPNTVYEAMAAGRAVVASRVGGIPELVADGETGLLVQSGDVEQLAAAITRLLREVDFRCALGRAGRQRIAQLAGLEENVSQRLAVYEEIAGRSATRIPC